MECQVLGTVGRGKHLVYKVRHADGSEEKLRKAQITKDILLAYFISQVREETPIDTSMDEGNPDPDRRRGPNRAGSSAPSDDDNQDSSRSNGQAPPPSEGPDSGRGQDPPRNYGRARRIPPSNTQPRLPRLPPEGSPFPIPGRQMARKSTASLSGPYRPVISKMSKFEKRK